MYYTITFNPAVDMVIQVENCQLGDLNRSSGEEYVAGGKGINVSFILNRLGIENTATGFLGGFSGVFIQQKVLKEGVTPHFVEVDGTTRINIKLKSDEETEINGAGPLVSKENFQDLYRYFEERLTDEDVVFLAGNSAPGLDEEAYLAIGRLCQEKGARFVLDTNKDLLTTCLAVRPFLIKPNHHELAEIFQAPVDTEDDIVTYAKKLQGKGARHVLVSRGGDGALLLTEDGEVYTSNVPKGEVINSAGAGDSMLAGFMATYQKSKDFAESLRMGTASGSATAFSVGIAERSLIDQLKEEIIVQRVK